MAWDEKIRQSKLNFPLGVLKIILFSEFFLGHGCWQIISSSPDVFFQPSVGKFYRRSPMRWGSFPPPK
jgi:hypothetical protein